MPRLELERDELRYLLSLVADKTKAAATHPSLVKAGEECRKKIIECAVRESSVGS